MVRVVVMMLQLRLIPSLGTEILSGLNVYAGASTVIEQNDNQAQGR